MDEKNRKILATFKPLKKQLLVVKHKFPNETKHGLIVNIYNDDNPNYGDVISMGDDVGIDVKVGDVVVFNHYSGNRVTYDQEEIFFMFEDDILARVTKEDIDDI